MPFSTDEQLYMVESQLAAMPTYNEDSDAASETFDRHIDAHQDNHGDI